MGLEEGVLAPNINFKTLKDGMDGIKSGRFHLVLENTPIEEQDKALVAINNFGFGGNNCHVVIKQMAEKKSKHVVPEDDLPRLICISGRTQEAVQSIIDDINNRALDVEYVALLHNLFSKRTSTHNYRGYTILSKSGPLKSAIVKSDPGHRSMLRVDFTGYEHTYRTLGRNFYSYPVFAHAIDK